MRHAISLLVATHCICAIVVSAFSTSLKLNSYVTSLHVIGDLPEKGKDVTESIDMNIGDDTPLSIDIADSSSINEIPDTLSINGIQSPTLSLPPPKPVPFVASADRAILIISELKSNAALFAAFAYGSLNLPPTLSVTESKITSVSTSLSIVRPLPESDLVKCFVAFDALTLCLMVLSVTASKLLIYSVSDGSWEDGEENLVGVGKNNSGAKADVISRLGGGRYGATFFVSRLSFDLGLTTLLLAVAVRTVAYFDGEIALIVLMVVTATLAGIIPLVTASYLPYRRTEKSKDGKSLAKLTFGLIVASAIAWFVMEDQMMIDNVKSELSSDGLIAGEGKLQSVLKKISEENRVSKVNKEKEMMQSRKRIREIKIEQKYLKTNERWRWTDIIEREIGQLIDEEVKESNEYKERENKEWRGRI